MNARMTGVFMQKMDFGGRTEFGHGREKRGMGGKAEGNDEEQTRKVMKEMDKNGKFVEILWNFLDETDGKKW